MSSLYVATEIGVVRLARSEIHWAGWHKEECGPDCPISPTKWHVFHPKLGRRDHPAGVDPNCELCEEVECVHPMFEMGRLLVDGGVAKWADWLSNTSGDLAGTDANPTIDKMPVIDALDPENEAVQRTLGETLRRLGFKGNLDGSVTSC